ncbi:MAG: hypothetical protein GY705_26910, partial [Bacteroidetes bacterium]|nr:hypothetical protein [Bacteroidota bacterium]
KEREHNSSPEHLQPEAKRRDSSIKAFLKDNRFEDRKPEGEKINTKMEEVIVKLQKDMNEMWSTFTNEMKEKQVKQEKDIEDLKNSLSAQSQDIEDMKKMNKSLRTAQEISEGVITRQEKQIEGLKGETVQAKVRSMSYNLVVSGIHDEISESRQSLIVKIDKLFKSDLKISPTVLKNVSVDRIHRGKGDAKRSSRPVIIKFKDSISKEIILRHTANLKGKKVYINEQFPPEINEKRKALLKKRSECKASGIQTKLVVDKLFIDGKKKKKNVLPLDSSIDYYCAAQDIHISHASQFTEMGSTFQGHVIKIKNPALYKAALYKLYQNKVIGGATHNIWAIKCGEREAYDDDGEYGAGYKLMEMLKENHINNVMVVVTRWHGGTQLGPMRFHHIKVAAMRALTHANVIKDFNSENASFRLKQQPTHSFSAEIEEEANKVMKSVTSNGKDETVDIEETAKMDVASGIDVSGKKDQFKVPQFPWMNNEKNDNENEHDSKQSPADDWDSETTTLGFKIDDK